MDIRFADRRLEKECNDARLLQRRHGERRAKLLMTRLTVLASAATLADIGPPYRGPMRCHELTGDRAGQLSIDLDQPYRLILRPDHDPPPTRDEGGLDWRQVTRILIVAIADTH
ncbi:killer suppression protein [Lysobacter arseniciresistens ZS79]|uniref:Killer suppression protein n=1 Tax=Lysobacter arseniciresistens ZS79 TaxID=913325 RepID=A0A0A0F3M4_9GAMM|nr:killer suppression protein [Lysobacter arseniciresistens]KGM57399.1 killer suppression protein [Lysobacter arseniciresistens ZS79]